MPSGLIHDWIGAAFIPNATIDEVLSMCPDYEQYEDLYRPMVIDSKAYIRDGPAFHRAPIAQTTGVEDRFSMLLMNRTLFLKTTLDGEFEASYFQVDDHHAHDAYAGASKATGKRICTVLRDLLAARRPACLISSDAEPALQLKL